MAEPIDRLVSVGPELAAFARRRGYGAIWLASMMLGAVAILGRFAVGDYVAQNEALERGSGILLQSRQDSLRASPTPAALAAIVSLYLRDDNGCATGTDEMCRRIAGSLDSFIAGAREADVASAAQAPALPTEAHTESALPDTLRECSRGDTGRADRGWCSDDGSIYVPPWASSRRSLALDRAAGFASGQWLDEIAHRLVDERPHDATRHVVQAYYVSAEGVVRAWTIPGGTELDRNLGDHVFAHDSYANIFGYRRRAILTGRYETSYYVDSNGYGLVRSSCVEHRDQVSQLLRGVFCVDYSPTVRRPGNSSTESQPASPPQVAEASTHEPQFTSVRETPDIGAAVASTLLYVSESGEMTVAVDDREGDPRLVEVLSRLRNSPPEQFDSLVFGVGADSTIVMPYARSDEGDRVYAVVWPQRHGPWLVGWLLLSLSVATVGFCAWLVATRIRAASQLLQDSVLRDLQGGVIRTDAKHRIVEANDRAEELFGCPLPSLGLPEGRADSRVSLQTLVTPVYGMYRPPKGGLAMLEGQPEAFRRFDFRKAEGQRRAGFSTRYFVRLRDDHARRSPELPSVGTGQASTNHPIWLTIWGSPWLSDGSEMPGTFGLVLRTERPIAALLEKRREKDVQDSALHPLAEAESEEEL